MWILPKWGVQGGIKRAKYHKNLRFQFQRFVKTKRRGYLFLYSLRKPKNGHRTREKYKNGGFRGGNTVVFTLQVL